MQHINTFIQLFGAIIYVAFLFNCVKLIHSLIKK